MDHKKLAEARIHAMTTADLNRFMVVACALVSDLYCPGYSSAEALSRESNLIRTAARLYLGFGRDLLRRRVSLAGRPSGRKAGSANYKVDASKITARVTAELSAKRKGGKALSHNL